MHLATMLRPSIRQFRQQPLYTFACAATLALAVAAATASFAVIKPAFLDPLPFAGGDALVTIYTNTETWAAAPVSARVMTEIEESGAPISGVAALDPDGAAYATAGSTEQVLGLRVTPAFFTTLGAPAVGRGFADDERDVAVLSWAFAQRALDGDPTAVGRSISLDGTPHTVVGVLPRDFAPPYWPDADILRPLDLAGLLATRPRGILDLTVIARRNEGVTQAQLDAHLAAFSGRVQRDHPDIHGRESWIAFPLRDELVGSARPALLGTAAAAVLLLLIVAANIAGLSAAVAVTVRHRLAVQAALGASRRRLLVERTLQSATIGVVGAAAGLWLADSLVGMAATFQPQFLGRMADISLEPSTLVLGFSAGVLVAVIAALIPHGAVIAGRLDPLPSARGATADVRLSAVRSALVVLQVALALVLIVGAGLLVRTVRNLADTATGFRSTGLHAMTMNLRGPRYEAPDAQIRFEKDVVAQLRRLPNVQDATASIGVPVIGGTRAPLTVYGRAGDDARGEVAYLGFAPGFIDLWDIRLVAGRDFGASDVVDGPGAIVINETLARRHWPAGDALGARIWIGSSAPEDPAEWMTVTGIVADLRQHGPTDPVLPTAFGSTHQYSWPSRTFSVRARDANVPIPAEDLRLAVHAVDPSVAVGQIRTVDDMIANDTAQHRLVMFALTFFGVVATILSGFGLFAVVSLTSRLRRREYAIRLAVGAEPAGLRWLVLRHGLMLAGAGVGVGIAVAVAGTRVLGGLLHGVTPLDAATFATTVTAITVLALLAAWAPARRAGRVAPVEILSAE